MSIKGIGGSIEIKLFGYENANSDNSSDANWLKSKIKISSGPFQGEFDATLTTSDFSCFEQELIQVLSNLNGKARFQTDEDWLSFDVEIGFLGTAVVQGTAKANDGSRTNLVFSFETDQSYLQQTMRALSDITQTFPVQRKDEASRS